MNTSSTTHDIPAPAAPQSKLVSLTCRVFLTRVLTFHLNSLYSYLFGSWYMYNTPPLMIEGTLIARQPGPWLVKWALGTTELKALKDRVMKSVTDKLAELLKEAVDDMVTGAVEGKMKGLVTGECGTEEESGLGEEGKPNESEKVDEGNGSGEKEKSDEDGEAGE